MTAASSPPERSRWLWIPLALANCLLLGVAALVLFQSYETAEDQISWTWWTQAASRPLAEGSDTSVALAPGETWAVWFPRDTGGRCSLTKADGSAGVWAKNVGWAARVSYRGQPYQGMEFRADDNRLADENPVIVNINCNGSSADGYLAPLPASVLSLWLSSLYTWLGLILVLLTGVALVVIIHQGRRRGVSRGRVL